MDRNGHVEAEAGCPGLAVLPVPAVLATESGTILAANALAGQLVGARASAIRGKPLAAFVAVRSRQLFRLAWGDVVARGGDREVDVQLHVRGQPVPLAARIFVHVTPALSGPRYAHCLLVPDAIPETGRPAVSGQLSLAVPESQQRIEVSAEVASSIDRLDG